jgi:protein involved in polysaccharide export with SLBB domain
MRDARAFSLLVTVAGLMLGQPALAAASLGPDVNENVIVHGPQIEGDYRLGTGDKVHVTVYNEDDLSGEFQVDGTGYVRLPLIGQVKAAGRTAHQLEGDVALAMEDGYLKNPRVNVEVTTYRPFYIIGQVNRPGQYAYVSNMSALDAIGLAGGFTEHAVESTVHIRHEGENQERDVAPDESVRIRPGDVVRVDPTLFWSVTSVLAPSASLAYALRP